MEPTILTKGKKYDTGTLVFVDWKCQEANNIPDAEGYSCWDYFDREGFYLGADRYGVEPLFTVKAGQES